MRFASPTLQNGLGGILSDAIYGKSGTEPREGYKGVEKMILAFHELGDSLYLVSTYCIPRPRCAPKPIDCVR